MLSWITLYALGIGALMLAAMILATPAMAHGRCCDYWTHPQDTTWSYVVPLPEACDHHHHLHRYHQPAQPPPEKRRALMRVPPRGD